MFVYLNNNHFIRMYTGSRCIMLDIHDSPFYAVE